MEKEQHILHLLKKFKEGELTPEEAFELQKNMKEGDMNTPLQNVLNPLWNEPVNDSLTIPSNKILAKIQNHILDSSNQSTPVKGFFERYLLPALKYAAVILITAGAVWFAKDFLAGREKKAIELNSGGSDNEITVSYGSKSKVTLPDGSTVNLNSGTTLRYPSKFDKNTRNVFVDGEAFFDVKKDPKHPFYVKTKDITIKVLGTKFNVESYIDDKTVKATLVTGVIEVYSNGKEITDKNRIALLAPHQQFIYNKTNGETDLNDVKDKSSNDKLKPVGSVLIQSKVDLTPVISWKDNRLIFRDETFRDLTKRMERWYDVEIEIKDEEIGRAVISGVFVKETVEQALNALKLATPFKYEMNRNHIIIRN